MRLAGSIFSAFAIAASGCAGNGATTMSARTAQAALPQLSGVWDGPNRMSMVDDGSHAGDTRIEKKEWHLTQTGSAISGYYLAAVTFLSADGRPYACTRQPRFSARERFDVAGRVQGGLIEIKEVGAAVAPANDHCDVDRPELALYRGRLDGDLLMLVAATHHETLRRLDDNRAATATTEGPEVTAADAETSADEDDPVTASAVVATPTDVSGLWLWEHQGTISGGDEKNEREEWHVTQDGDRLSGYYDRTVHQVSADGHAYRCSNASEFQIVTRYRFNGEVRGSQVVIYESSFQVMDPNACDNGKRRLDAYEGQASSDELRLVWGIGGQILHRARPDVPTQRF